MLDGDGNGIPDLYEENTNRDLWRLHAQKMDSVRWIGEIVGMTWWPMRSMTDISLGRSCLCVPDCLGKQCGIDGCGLCGVCGGNEICDSGSASAYLIARATLVEAMGVGACGVVDDCGVCNGDNACAGCDGVANSGLRTINVVSAVGMIVPHRM